MNVYKITGTIITTAWPQVHGDELCDAFDGVDKPFRVNQVVVAETKQAALDALRTIPGALPDASAWWDTDEDLESLTVEPAPPAIAMKALGMPTLFEVAI